MDAKEVLDREFLTVRSQLLAIAASFDRIDRAAGRVSEEQSLILLKKSLEILSDAGPDRAERLQLLFSREYDPQWKDKFQLRTLTS